MLNVSPIALAACDNNEDKSSEPFINDSKIPPSLSNVLSINAFAFFQPCSFAGAPTTFWSPPQNSPRLYVTECMLPSKSKNAARGFIFSYARNSYLNTKLND